MSNTFIKKELINYINNNVFINFLNIPEYQNQDSDSNILKSISEKLDILLKLPHQEFWCHIIFDHSVLRSLQSYFNNASRPIELILNNITWQQIDKELNKKYYLLILRIISNKEAKIPEFNNINFGTLIYDNFIIDIPFLFDLCSLYGEHNPDMISKMIGLIFSCQPLYLNDFREFATITIKLLEEKITDFIANDPKTSKENRDFRLFNKNYHPIEEKSIEILLYIIDLCYSWNGMLNAVTTNRELFHILIDLSFHKTIEKLFQKFVPIMLSNVDKFEISDPERLKQLLSVCCFFMISVWRKIFNGNYLNRLVENCQSLSSSTEENFELINDCIAVIHSCQEYSVFADAMYLVFPIQNDFDLIFQAVKSDKEQFYSEFVNDAIKETIKEISGRQTMFSLKSSIENPLNSLSMDRDLEPEGSNCTDSNIIQIIDIFPHLTEREIKAYIKCHDCKPTDLLEALLNDVISIDLIKTTAIANRYESENRKPSFDYQAVLNNLRNIYDGDQLETGQVKASQLHLGKRQSDMSKTVDENLRNMILNIVEKQNEEEEEEAEKYPINENLNYNDEFDDVYGISNDQIIYDKKEELNESKYESKKLPKAYRTTKKNNEMNNNEKGAASTASQKLIAANAQTEQVATIMEPSKLKFSVHDKKQFKKKRFQDGPSKISTSANNGFINHRLGSHAPKESSFVKRDHRSKAQKNQFNEL